MGAEAAPTLARALMAQGRAASTPAVAVENAGASHARLTETTLAGLAVAPLRTEGGPLLIVIGEVAALAATRSSHCADRRAFA
jgi:uroporphyrin-III C-methyltransferase